MRDLTDRMDKLMAVVKGLESNMNKRFDTLSGAVLGIYERLEWYKAFIDSLSGDEDAFDREAAGFQAETCCKFQTETTPMPPPCASACMSATGPTAWRGS